MSLFDDVTCEYALPDPTHQDREFQTKDLDSQMHHYVITRDGRLIRKARPQGVWGETVKRDVEWPYHGDVRINAFDGVSAIELTPERARPSPQLVVQLRAGKAALRAQRTALPLREKVRQLLQLQEIYVSLLGKRRSLQPWERPWRVEP
jgi:hypothetical protein